MTFLFAELAALCNAFNVVAQHAASTTVTSGSWWRVAVKVVRQPLWLLGGAALIGGFVFQALALHRGQLSVVQPLLVTELVFALVLRRLWLRQHIRPAAWGAAVLTCAGVGFFVAASEPTGGNASATTSAWLAAGVAAGSVAALLVILASWGSPVRRAALYATAAGVVWALVATFIKTTTDILTTSGISGMLTSWPVYALIVGGIAGTLLVQAALHVGPISVSQPLMVAVDPFVSIILAVWLFGEHFTADALHLTIAVLAFAAMVVGILLLSKTAPVTLTEGVEPPSAARPAPT